MSQQGRRPAVRGQVGPWEMFNSLWWWPTQKTHEVHCPNIRSLCQNFSKTIWQAHQPCNSHKQMVLFQNYYTLWAVWESICWISPRESQVTLRWKPLLRCEMRHFLGIGLPLGFCLQPGLDQVIWNWNSSETKEQGGVIIVKEDAECTVAFAQALKADEDTAEWYFEHMNRLAPLYPSGGSCCLDLSHQPHSGIFIVSGKKGDSPKNWRGWEGGSCWFSKVKTNGTWPRNDKIIWTTASCFRENMQFCRCAGRRWGEDYI